MKRNFTLLIAILFTANLMFAQVETIANWTFPTGTEADANPDVANANNISQTVFTEGGTSAIDFSKNGETTKSAQATGWDGGMDTKSWQISVNTTGYSNLLLSSMITAGGTDAGPKDFKIQYKIGETGMWTDVPDGTVTVANDWITGVTEDLELPVECNDESLIYIRWIMTSNLNINDETLVADGKSKIDNVIVTGAEIITDVSLVSSTAISVYPNPTNGIINIKSSSNLKDITMYDMTGKLVFNSALNSLNASFDFNDYANGIYIVKITNKTETITRRITIR